MDDHSDLDEVFKALADPTRRRLLDSLRRENGQTLGELCADIAMTRQSVTQHVDQLVAANLIAVVRNGRERRHYLNPVPIHEIERRWLKDFDRPHLEAIRTITQRSEEKAMSSTFPDFVYVTYIHASPEQVWEALTDANITSLYWNGMANFSDWQVGSQWTHRVGGENGQHHIWGRVLESDPPRRLSFTFQPAAQPLDQEGSIVTYNIEPHLDTVKLTVTHSNVPDSTTLEGISSGWPTVLSNLKSFLETGSHLPNSWALLNH